MIGSFSFSPKPFIQIKIDDAPTIADGIKNQYQYEIESDDEERKYGILKRSKLYVEEEYVSEPYFVQTKRGYEFDANDAVIDHWEPAQPIFISAQTGKGKNYFVENVLLQYVNDTNYKYGLENRVLILTNRLSLWRQTLTHLGTEIDYEAEELHAYGNIAWVTTYQSFFQRISEFQRSQRRPESQYVYVICDEAHFFYI